MLKLKGIICIATFILLFFGTNDLFSLSEVKWIGIILGIIFCLLLKKNWLIIPKIELFIAICSFIWLTNTIYNDWKGILCHILIIVATVILLLICVNNYYKDIEIHEEISSIKRCTIICANDTTFITGHGTRRYIYSSISEKSEYNHYYILEDGDIIPVDNITDVHFITSNEEPYIETVVTTRYEVDNNNNPATCKEVGKTTTYILYAPLITNE